MIAKGEGSEGRWEADVSEMLGAGRSPQSTGRCCAERAPFTWSKAETCDSVDFSVLASQGTEGQGGPEEIAQEGSRPTPGLVVARFCLSVVRFCFLWTKTKTRSDF